MRQVPPDTDARNHDAFVISYDEASKLVLDDLCNHLAWMLTPCTGPVGNDGEVPLSEANNTKVLNIDQHMMLQATGVQMPQHVGLADYILNQTGSRDIVQTCN